MSLCIKAQGELFQTQAARDSTRQQFAGSFTMLPTYNSRFPISGYYVYVNNAKIKPIYSALLKSFDTKNRVLETEEETRPTNGEIVSATQRVDDATVAIRSQLMALSNELQNGSGFFDRTSFETIVHWSEVSTSGK